MKTKLLALAAASFLALGATGAQAAPATLGSAPLVATATPSDGAVQQVKYKGYYGYYGYYGYRPYCTWSYRYVWNGYYWATVPVRYCY